MSNLNTSDDKDKDVQRTKRNKKFWFWGCGGCLVLLLIVGFIIAGFFYVLNSPPNLDGEISVPPKIQQGDEFDIIITLKNPTEKSVFIEEIFFHNYLEAPDVIDSDVPNLLDGANIISTNPEMESETFIETDVIFPYFREIHTGDTQTIIFHMKAENIGVFMGDIGVYAKHPYLGEPFFQIAQYFSAVKIEITP
jgi:hypothetical protein